MILSISAGVTSGSAGDDYFAFIEQFVDAVKEELPETCLQWEDFANPHARPILERYRDQLLTFNDDIQGTAAVALGAILGAIKVTGKSLRINRSSCSVQVQLLQALLTDYVRR